MPMKWCFPFCHISSRSRGVTLWKSKHKIENSSASNHAMKLKLGEHVIA